jgi:hypothetical protein
MIDVKFDEKEKTLMLLTSFLASYHIQLQPCFGGKETLETEEFMAILLACNQRKQSIAEGFGEGLVAKGNQDHGRRKENDRSDKRNN